MTLIIPLSQESTKAVPVDVTVEADRGSGAVTLTQNLPASWESCPYLSLLPDEARALAAALVHYADEADR